MAGELATLANLKDYLRIKINDDDAVLTRLITSASEWFKSQVKREFIRGSYTETHQLTVTGFPRANRITVIGFTPRVTPVASVTSLTLDGTTVPAQSAIDLPGYHLDNFSRVNIVGYQEYVNLAAYDPGRAVIQYTGGYTTSPWAIPADVEQAVIQLAAWRYRERDRIGQNSKSLGDETVSYSQAAAAADVMLVVEAYRRPQVS